MKVFLVLALCVGAAIASCPTCRTKDLDIWKDIDVDLDLQQYVRNEIENIIRNDIVSDVDVNNNAAEAGSEATALGENTKTITQNNAFTKEDYLSQSSGFAMAASDSDN
eukprot:TRINITY_DN351_c0_g1_i5.p3 TRINITY_DN351_c0_g1~~TRINITY_DN351_c0_g1_i5.p3  ORF type:complete len:109 (-),score=17.82 TRINITY_DN351_c0_g1_i5:80-406(-)